VACKPPPPRAGGGSHATPPQGGWLPLIATAQTPNSFLLLLKRKIVFSIFYLIFSFFYLFLNLYFILFFLKKNYTWQWYFMHISIKLAFFETFW
jgi:hypothetical protein